MVSAAVRLKKYRQDNPEKVRGWRERYRCKYPEKVREWNRKYRQKKKSETREGIIADGTSRNKVGVSSSYIPNMNKDEAIIYEIKKKVLESPLEDMPSSMTTSEKGFSLLWRPNNYRRQMKVKLKDNSTLIALRRGTTENGWVLNVNEHTKLVSVRGFGGITIQYGKDTLTGIYSQNLIGGEKETFLIEADCVADVEERIDQKKEAIRVRIDEALVEFSKLIGVWLPFEKPVWSRFEDWIKGEDYIDKIPREVIVHDTYFKKVYGEGIEFKGGVGDSPTASLKNYIKNRAVEDVSPLIVDELKEIGKKLESSEFSEILKEGLKAVVSSQVEVYKQLGIMVEAQINTQNQLSSLILAVKPVKSDLKEEIKTRPWYVG